MNFSGMGGTTIGLDFSGIFGGDLSEKKLLADIVATMLKARTLRCCTPRRCARAAVERAWRRAFGAESCADAAAHAPAPQERPPRGGAAAGGTPVAPDAPGGANGAHSLQQTALPPFSVASARAAAPCAGV